MVKDLHQVIKAEIDTLRGETGDTVKITEIGAVVERFLAAGAQKAPDPDSRVHREIHALLHYIKRAKAEIEAIQPHKICTRDIPGATDELDAVIAATEDATERILDAAEDIEKMAADAGGDTAEKLKGVATKIYEASNFQDLTGQRITKVVSILHHIEERIGELAEVCGNDQSASETAPPARAEEDGIELHGPQSGDTANVQDDIDKILADMD